MKGEVIECGGNEEARERMWENLRYPEKSLRYVELLMSRLKTPEGRVRFVLGMAIAGRIRKDHPVYIELTAAAYILALDSGIDARILDEIDIDERRGQIIGLERAAKRATVERIGGKRVGLIHGNHSQPTPRSVLHLIMASERCDCLFLGLEESGRGVEAEKLLPGLADCTFVLNRPFNSSYDLKYLLQKIKPGVYFGNVGDSERRRQELAESANRAGCVYAQLDYINGRASRVYEAPPSEWTIQEIACS